MHPQPIEHAPMTAGEIIAARAAYGLTSADLAHILGVNERTARRWEAGTTHPNGAVAAEIHAIDARIDQLADHLANQWGTARECGLSSLELPETADDIPDEWGRVTLGMVRVAAWRAHTRHGARFTRSLELLK